MTTGQIYYSTLTDDNSQINSAFLHGESVFTSSRIINGKIKFKEFHLLRLKKGVEYLLDYKDSTLLELLSRRLLEVEKSELVSIYNYIRITFFKDLKNEVHFNIFLSNKEIKDEALKIKSYPSPYLEFLPSFVKPGNYLLENHIKKNHGEVLFFDSSSNILELTTSNIFVVIDGVLKTPPIDKGVLDGIYRANLIKIAHELNIAFKEENIKLDQLNNASMIFATNSFLGIKSISELDGKSIPLGEDAYLNLFRERIGF